MKFRSQVALTCTILLAGGWCLAQSPPNKTWLPFSLILYLKHVGLWLLIGAFIYLVLHLAGRKSLKAENRLMFVFLIVSFLNLLDYGMLSIFGFVCDWSIILLISWSVTSIALPALALYFAYKINVSQSVIKNIVKICILPCFLLIYYAVPPSFTTVYVEKFKNNENRTPIHLILFDSLSYDVLFKDDKVSPLYSNFKSFAHDAHVFINASSQADCTYFVIPRLLTGIDFEQIAVDFHQVHVGITKYSQMVPLSSFETLFSFAHKEKYDLFLRAFAIPYLDMFGEYIQSGRVYPFDNPWRTGIHSLVSPILFPGGLHHQKVASFILKDYTDRIYSGSENTLFYIHWNIPHLPFIFDEAGNMLGRFEYTKQLLTKQDSALLYLHQVKGTDKVLGKIVEAMKKSGTYDKSLIIVTSDTNVGGFGFDIQHVPLFIKQPHQNRSKTFYSEVLTRKVFDYVKYFIREKECDNTLLQASAS